MMFSCYLASRAGIMQSLNPALVAEMSTLASSLHTAMATYGVVTDPVHGQIYAYKVDGCGSRTIMDDANIPSLLSAPFFSYVNASSAVYQNTRNQYDRLGCG